MSNPTSPNYVPGVGRLVTDRFDFAAHTDGDGFRHNATQIDLSPPINISGHGTFTDAQSVIAELAILVNSIPAVPMATDSVQGTIQLAGDISGLATSLKVSGIQGQPVSVAAPSNGQVLTFNSGSWAPAAPSAASGAASGDLAGTYPSPTVVALRGHSVAVTAPTSNKFLGWNGSAWTPTDIAIGGDVLSSNITNTVVAGIRGRPILATAPSTNYSIIWNGSAWAILPTAANLARAWNTNGGTVTPTAVTITGTPQVTITPRVTGKIRVTVTGYATNTLSVPGTFAGFFIGVTNTQYGSSLTENFTKFLGAVEGSTGTDGGNLGTISYSFDYDTIPVPHLFTLNTPVTFNVLFGNIGVSAVGLDTNAVQFEVQEVF